MARIYITSSNDFKEQVEFRITILRAWAHGKIPVLTSPQGTSIRDDMGEEVLEYFPFKALEDFCSWTAALNAEALTNVEYSFEGNSASLGLLQPVARSTLNRTIHTDLRARARTAMRMVKARGDLQLKSENKNSRISELEARVKFLEELCDTQEKECRDLRKRHTDDVSQLTKERRSSDNKIARLKEDKARLEEKISELIKSAAKVSPIKAIGKSTK